MRDVGKGFSEGNASDGRGPWGERIYQEVVDVYFENAARAAAGQ